MAREAGITTLVLVPLSPDGNQMNGLKAVFAAFDVAELGGPRINENGVFHGYRGTGRHWVDCRFDGEESGVGRSLHTRPNKRLVRL
jgi:hypothetical protein